MRCSADDSAANLVYFGQRHFDPYAATRRQTGDRPEQTSPSLGALHRSVSAGTGNEAFSCGKNGVPTQVSSWGAPCRRSRHPQHQRLGSRWPGVASRRCGVPGRRRSTGRWRSRSTSVLWTARSERRRFLGEAKAAGNLSGHPGIVTVHDAGILADGRPYLVMKLCTGGSLTAWLRPDNRQSVTRICSVGVQHRRRAGRGPRAGHAASRRQARRTS